MKMHLVRRVPTVMGASAFLFTSVTTAQTSAPAVPILPETVVTASRLPTSSERTLAPTTIITRADIEAQRPTSIIEILRQVPGLHIDAPSGRGSVSSAYLRGGDPNYTLVLIDGVRANDPTNSRGGSYDFSVLPLDHIERIEVVRGPLSSIYGSDAISGVINIITRSGGAKSEHSLDAAGGRFGFHRETAATSGPIGRGTYALVASHADDGEPVRGSHFVSSNLSGSFSLAPSDTTALRFHALLVDADRRSFPDDSGGPSFAVLREVDTRDTREVTAGADFMQEIRPWWNYELKFGLFDRTDEFSSPGVAPGLRDPFGIPPNRSNDDFRRYQATWVNRFQPMAGIRVGAGLEYQRESGRSRGELIVGPASIPTRFDLDRDIGSPFAELELSPVQNLVLQGSIRWDIPHGFDQEVSPRVGAAYTVAATGTTLRTSWGEGFKLPSFFALGNPIVGNPQLRPESSRGHEFGISQTVGKDATVRATYFRSRVADAIDFEEGPPPRLVNRSRVDAEGIEFGSTFRLSPEWTLDTQVTFVQTDIAGTEEQLRNRPKWRGGATLGWRPRDDVDLSARALYVGRVLDSSIPTGDLFLDPFWRVDLTAQWLLTLRWSLYAGIENLLDEPYEEAIGFPVRGIRPLLGTRITF